MTEPLSGALTGTWELLNRVTVTESGREIPPLFGDAIALVIYDGHGNFSAQFMKKDRQNGDQDPESGAPPPPNNSRSVGGYDAYFGRYVVDDATGNVTQTLTGSLSPGNVGQVLTRRMSVENDELTIRVDTATEDGEPAVLTLRWRRVG